MLENCCFPKMNKKTIRKYTILWMGGDNWNFPAERKRGQEIQKRNGELGSFSHRFFSIKCGLKPDKIRKWGPKHTVSITNFTLLVCLENFYDTINEQDFVDRQRSRALRKVEKWGRAWRVNASRTMDVDVDVWPQAVGVTCQGGGALSAIPPPIFRVWLLPMNPGRGDLNYGVLNGNP